MGLKLRGRALVTAALTLCLAAFAAVGQAAESKKKSAAKSPPSPCVGLSESTCAGNAICYWRKATTLKSGKTRRAHCRKKPKTATKQATPT